MISGFSFFFNYWLVILSYNRLSEHAKLILSCVESCTL